MNVKVGTIAEIAIIVSGLGTEQGGHVRVQANHIQQLGQSRVEWSDPHRQVCKLQLCFFPLALSYEEILILSVAVAGTIRQTTVDHWNPVRSSDFRARVCLVHFAKKNCKGILVIWSTKWSLFAKFFHRWVVNREMNLMMLINSCLINN